MNIRKFISVALDDLNDENGGDSKFETLCKNLISEVIDQNFLGSTGLVSGGDGGIDGWAQAEDREKRKYSFTIDKSTKKKIDSEIKKWNKSRYHEMVFFSNQPIPQRMKESYSKTEQNLTFYDKENLIDYIEKHPHLGRFVDLPFIKRVFEKGLLIDNHQLMNEVEKIKLLLHRYLNHIEHDEIITSPPNDVIFQHKVTIIEGTAGYGKSSLLKTLYLSILDQEILPVPIIIKLKDYIPGSLNEQIYRALPFEASGLVKDFTLLLDGYDEISEENRKNLIKEINQILTTPNVSQYFILTVRSGQYNSSDFSLFDIKPKITYLAGLNSTNIEKLLIQYGLENNHDLLHNTFFKENSHNPFYAVRIIKFFKKYNSYANSIIDLMEYVVHNEIDIKFKSNKPSRNILEDLALYMTLNQIPELSKDGLFEIGVKSFPENLRIFSFSHKNIQEYLAASKLSKLNNTKIKNIIAIGTKIIPYLSNMFGYILNIICQSDSSPKFNEIVEWALKDNSKKLISIEPDKIQPSLNAKIFSKILEEEINSLNVAGISDQFIRFMIRNENNIQLLIEKIFPGTDEIDSDADIYYVHLLQKLVLYERYNSADQILSVDDNSKIINSFIDLLEKNEKQERIGSLYYSFSYLSSLESLRSDQISLIITKTESLCDQEGVFDNLCHAIINSKHNLSFNDFRFLLKIALNSMDRHGAVFSAIPDEVDDDFQTPIMHIVLIYNFHELSKLYIKNNPEYFWQTIIVINRTQADNKNLGNDLKEYHYLIFNLAIEMNLLSEKNIDKEVFIEFLLLQLEQMNANYWIDRILEIYNFTDQIFWSIVKELIEAESFMYFSYYELASILYKKIHTINDFEAICDYYSSVESEKEIDFFNYFRHELPEEHPNFEDIFSSLSEENRNHIQNRIQQQTEYKQNQLALKEKPKKDIMVLFSAKELNKAFSNLFNSIGKEVISKDDLIEQHYFSGNIKINNFIVQYLMQHLKDGVSFIKVEIESSIKEIYGYNWGLHIAQYVSRYNINIADFDMLLKESVFEWIENTLTQHPMKSVEDCKYFSQQVICYLLNQLNEKRPFPPEILLGASLSGFPLVIEGVYSHNYESFSIDYLDNHLDSSMIIKYLLNNFKPDTANEFQTIVFSGYLLKKLGILLTPQKQKIKNLLISYIENNIDTSYNLDVRRLMNRIKITLEDISEEKIINALYLENGKLKFNYASSFFLHEIPENKSFDNSKILGILKKAYSKSEGKLKIKLAEAIISRSEFAGRVFVNYVKYILKSEKNKISSRFTLGGFGGQLSTADYKHLALIKKLYIYSLQKKSDRRQAISEIALSSYNNIGQSISQRWQLNKLIQTLHDVAKATGNQFVKQHAYDIEAAYLERQYLPPSWKQIKSMH